MGFLPLVINDEVRAQMRAVIARAEADPTTLEQIQKLRSGELIPAALSEGKTLDIPMGFHVVYTVEEQAHGTLRHLSMSITALEGRVPHPEAVRMVMEEMGFIHPLERCLFWQEDCGGERMAINVVEPLDGDWEPFKNPSPTSDTKIAGFESERS